MKLTLDFASFQKKIKEIESKLESSIDDSKFLNEVGQMVVGDIKRNAKSGFTIEKDGTTKRMEPLTNVTIEKREWLRRAGNAKAKPYRDNFSNLSMSGQLIDSIDYKIDGNKIEIDAHGERQPYKTLAGQVHFPIGPDNERLNKDLLDKHQKGDPEINLPARRIVGLRRQIINRINIMFKEAVRRKLKV
jgi:hypothetical protein